MENIAYVFFQFIIYSLIGYLVEVIYCSILQKKLVNRGFLVGPICPIYGIGAILTIYSLNSFKDNPVIIFILGILIKSALEYYTSYIFEKIFNNKWWDYSDKKYNINGRICLSNAIFFGIGAVLGVYLLDPLINNNINKLPDNFVLIIGSVLLVLLIVDLIYSSKIAYNLRSKLIIAEQLKQEKIKLIPVVLEKKYKERIAKIKNYKNRLIKNYPNLSKNLQNELSIISKMIEKYNVNKYKKSKKN